ncbi:putative wall-associated receptor kinase [Helianthus annuus]|uniref:Wall-associated receptor kinase n=1 Tax=Helianthus annuus TaxID=4232 RepID=A0A251TRJ7_HELAN|nr:putative wall-associated receptor kinase [Helianthus annuus]KAJ0886421.1 putative wall-associated receptor kinase [Helianthus annuus]KAJ0959408.1 putative wall-associated receptor kinase [Helianthus annuus]
MKFFQLCLHLLTFLLVTATAPAIAKYAKRGCNGKCGRVRIPYPFGIGAGCSFNKWYIIGCNNSKPYLPALSNLEVLGINLRNQTVTVNAPKTSDCGNLVQSSSQTTSFDLGESPFWFSKSHNKFVFEGCGTAAMMDGGSVVTGCSTACPGVTFSDRNNCFGIGCCKTAIPYYVKSYSINLTGLERQGDDGGCGSAFLVDETLYNQGRFSDPYIFKNTSVIPTSLLWTLTDSNKLTCCDNRTPVRRRVDVFNDTPVDTWKCGNYYTASSEDSPYLIDGCRDSAIPKYAKTGCKDKCGNVTIPYPFGIGADCSVNKWYIVDCNSSTPYLPALNHLELLDVNLEEQIVNVSASWIPYCQSPVRNSSEIMGVEFGSSPFWFSKSHNKFVFEGCGTASMHMDNGSIITGCSSTCRHDTLGDRNNCFGNGCCQTAIPHYLKSYNINLTGLIEEKGCRSAFLVEDETSYEKSDEGRFSNPSIVRRKTSVIVMSLMWTLKDSDQVTCCYNYPYERILMDMFNGTTVDTLICYNEWSTEGTPYLVDGCKFDNEEKPTEECRRCQDIGGNCRWDTILDVDDELFSRTFNCIHDGERTSLRVILGNVFFFFILFIPIRHM